MDKAKSAIKEGKWQVGYRFLEDSLVSKDIAEKKQAIDIYQSTPQLKAAAVETFNIDTLRNTIYRHGPTEGIAIERRRLAMYSIIADEIALQRASENLEQLIREHPDFVEREAAEARRRSEEEADMRRAEADALRLELEFLASKEKAFVKCKDRAECDKAFALTQIFIATNSDMKIQMANETIIETYNPIKEGAMGVFAIKTPMSGTSAEIRLHLSCKATSSKAAIKYCKAKSISINQMFPTFLNEKLIN